MVRSPSTLIARTKRAGVAGLLAALLLNAGCLGLEKSSWFSSKPEVPPPATHMDITWYKQVRYIPDPTRGGAMSAGIAGRMYLWGSDHLGFPLIGNGNVTVELYDDSQAVSGKQATPKETTTFGKDMLPKLLQKDTLGNGYTLLVPCPKDMAQVHMVVRFEQGNGGAPLFASSATIALDHGNQPLAPATPTTASSTVTHLQ